MSFDKSLKVIIVEDEQASADYLADLLRAQFPDLAIVAQEDSVQGAVRAIQKHAPDLVFMDIAIKMGTGFDVLARVDADAFRVIFTTAFDQYAIDAFQYSAVDYLLKPLNGEKVVHAVQRSLKHIAAKKSNEEIISLLQYLKSPAQQRLAIHTMNGIEFVNNADILFAEADGNYCKLKLRSGKSMIVTRKIKELAGQLPEPAFMRIHLSYLVNTSHVVKYKRGRGGEVVLEDGTTLPVAPSRKEDLMRSFGQ